MKNQPHIEIYYLGESETGVLGRAVVMDDYNKARINNAYVSMFTKNQAVLLHEMLHAIGLAHSEDANSVMNANYNQSQVLTEQDLANIKNIPCGSKKKKKK
jgi:predicted Zn-dependent protease